MLQESINSISSKQVHSIYIPFIFRGIAILVFVFVIPLEFLIGNWISESEDSLICDIQTIGNSNLDDFFKIISYAGSHTVIIVILPILFNCLNSVRTIKINIIICHLLYIYSFISVLLTEPRPYWKYPSIKSRNCQDGYGSPSEPVLFSMVFYLYAIVELFETNNKTIKSFFWVLSGVWVGLVGFTELYLGDNFLHQVILSICLGFVYLTGLFTTNMNLSYLSLASTYYTKKTRVYQIYWLLSSLGMLLILLLLRTNIPANENINITWIQNAYTQCNFSQGASGYYSFYQSSWVFYNLGSVCGSHFTSKRLPVTWWKSKVYIRLFRAVISSGISYGIFIGFSYIHTDDPATKYTFCYVIRNLLSGFIVFGLLPLIFSKLRLTNSIYEKDETLVIGKYDILSEISMKGIPNP
jgi:PAP2 superfamily